MPVLEKGSVAESAQQFIARARDAFNEDGVETPGVRGEVLSAWKRSKAAGVPSSGGLLEGSDDVDSDSALLRAVRPVSRMLMANFLAEDVAMMVTDRDARIVGQWFSGHFIHRKLDRLGVHLGSRFDESYVGSTALGTALESSGSVVMDGAEHYNNTFDSVVAVGTPIINPATGVTEGVIDLVCPTGAPVGLLLPLITNAAREAGELLLSGYARDDRELLDAFMQTERRGGRRPMVALNGRMLLANNPAGDILSGRPHTLLWEDIQRAINDGSTSVLLDGDDQRAPLRARIRAVHTEQGSLGAVLHLSPVGSGAERTARPPSPARNLAASVSTALPGRSLRWSGAIRAVCEALVADRSVAICGPSGSGKSSLARSAAQAWSGCDSTTLVLGPDVDPPSSVADVAPEVRAIVIEDADLRLDTVRALLSAFEIERTSIRLVLTLTPSVSGEKRVRALTPVSSVIEIPSLAHRAADIGELVQAWAARREDGGCAVDAEAVRELMKRPWPGNVRQLFWTLDVAASTRTGISVRREDLPSAGSLGRPRRQLTYLENVEREAIARLLEAADGRKVEVARELGVSRSTLYRKLAALGLDG